MTTGTRPGPEREMADELTLTNTARMWGNRAHLAGLAVAVSALGWRIGTPA
jgi:hypothetical protein